MNTYMSIAAVSYLLGSIPFGYLLVRVFRGEDVRSGGSGNIGATVAALRSEPGRDIWLFGGGSLFASLLGAQVVDQIEVAIMPVLLGSGTPLVSAVTPRSGLILTRSNTSPSGIVNLQYQVNP